MSLFEDDVRSNSENGHLKNFAITIGESSCFDKNFKVEDSLTHSGVATNGPELVTETDRPIDFLSVRDVPGVLGGVASPGDRASTSLVSDSLAGLRTSFTDTRTKRKSSC